MSCSKDSLNKLIAAFNCNSAPTFDGLVKKTDTDVTGWTFVLDEDTMASDSATKLATQQSIKAYVDSTAAAGIADGDKGDITVSGGGSTWTIDGKAVTFSKIEDVATDVILGRVTAGSGDIEELTAAQARTLLNVEDGADVTDATNVNAAGATMNADTSLVGNGWFLDDDTFAADDPTKTASQQSIKAYVDATAGGITDGDKGDITVSVGGTVWTIDNSVVTLAKVADIANSTILGRATAGAGVTEELSAAQVRTLINVEDGAEVNNISDVNATDLTDAGDSTLHFHAADRARANHTGTQTLATISDSGDAAAKGVTGLDANAVTGTAGTSGDLSVWNADGDLVDGPTPPTGTIVGTTDTQTLTNKTIDVDSNTINNFPVVIAFAVSDETTDLTTGTAKATFRMPWAMTLTDIRASVTTAPVGSTIEVDVNETGTTILSTVISIDASEKTSETAATAPVISDSALADDAEITIDIDQVGSSTAGAGLKVYLIGTRNV